MPIHTYALVKRGGGVDRLHPALSRVKERQDARRIGRMSVAFANSASTASRLGSSNVPSCVVC